MLAMLSDYIKKVKPWVEANKQDLYIAVLIFLVGMTSFGLGRLSILWPKKEPIRIDQVGENGQVDKSSASGGLVPPINNFTKRSDLTASPILSSRGRYVASKSGTAYHYPWCQGALKIKEENKVWFNTKEEAEKAGYKPAGNCEGL